MPPPRRLIGIDVAGKKEQKGGEEERERKPGLGDRIESDIVDLAARDIGERGGGEENGLTAAGSTVSSYPTDALEQLSTVGRKKKKKKRGEREEMATDFEHALPAATP